MLARAAVSIGLEVNRPPSPEPSRLDDWFLGAGRGSQPRPAPVPFFPEVHEELTKSWMAPFTARSPSSASSILTTLDGGVARGYAGIPQVERAITVHLYPRNAATWRNRPRLPSKACKLTAALAAKAYSAAGLAASALHAMAILQVHQARALKQVHEDSTDPGLMQELRTATDFALRATKVTARSLGKAMSTMVVQERHLWLNLVEMKDVDKAHFLDAPISQAGLFGDTVEGFAQQFSAVQQQTEANQHTCPGVMHHPPLPPGPGLSLPIAVGALMRPPELLHPRLNRYHGLHVEPLAGERRPPRPSQAPSRPGSRRSGPDAGNPEMLEFALSQETARTAPLLPLVEDREENLPFLFLRWSKGQRYPLSQERAISFSSGFSGPWDDSVRRPASSLLPTNHFASSQETTVRGRHSSPRTSGQSRLGPREFVEDASERTAFCTIHPYSLLLHHHEYVDCAVGAAWVEFDSATWFSSLGDLPSSTAFSRRRWQSGTPLSCTRRLLSSWQRTQSSRSLQPRGARHFTALTSSYSRNVVAFDQSWICEFWTGLYTSSRSRCGRAGALSIGLQQSTWRMLTFMFRSFCYTDRSYGLRSKVGHGSTGSSPSGSPCLPMCSRRS